jgi:hypothetical protein
MDHEGRSVVGTEEGWSENQSDAGVSVNDGDRLGVVDKHGEPTGINQRVDEKVVSEEVREGDFEKAADKEGVKGVNTEVAEWDVDFVGSRVGENGSGGSEVMETVEGLAQEQGLGSHVNLECVVVEHEKVEEEGQQILASGLNEVGLDIGPAIVLGQREGKQIMVVEEPSDKILKGGNSLWATRVTSPLKQRVEEENNDISENDISDDTSINEVGQDLADDMGQVGRRKTKEGCKKLPLFFGPNKWVQYTNAKNIKGGKKSKKKKGVKKKRQGVVVIGDSQEDDIHMESSEATEGSGGGGRMVNRTIPISNIQIVLNEGEVSRPNEGRCRQIRVEAERLFHIGLNLGITSNEERLSTLERMAELEAGDEAKFVADGGDEGFQ